MISTKKNREDDRLKGLQITLFPEADAADFEATLNWLKRYREMELAVRDFEQHMEEYQSTVQESESTKKIAGDEYYSNKTANAVILTERQLDIYRQFKFLVFNLDRARRLILYPDAQHAIYLRYIKGYSYKEAFGFYRNQMSDRTFDRLLAKGIRSMANTLKNEGVLEKLND